MNNITKIYSKLVGVTFEGRQNNIKSIQNGFNLFWEHEVNNKYDPNAIHVYADPSKQISLGHLSREMAEKFVNWKNKGDDLKIICSQVTGGKLNQSFGVNIEIHIGVKNE